MAKLLASTVTTSTHADWLDKALTRIDEAKLRGKADLAHRARARRASYDEVHKRIVIDLMTGASFSFPARLAQGLAGSKAADLAKVELTPLGTGVHWPTLDVDFTVDGLLAGVFGTKAWTRAIASKAGSAQSPSKAAAARANGVKGGRPRRRVGEAVLA
jgi:Protein of unknown function (DUF2442)